MAQTNQKESSLPFRAIPAYPESYSNENIVARMIDGLGFRFYWATEGLRTQDLAFKPNNEARSTEETIDHVMGLTNVILNSINNKPNVRSGEETSKLPFEEKRRIILINLKTISDTLKKSDLKIKDMKIIQQGKDNKREFPFWNMINGPISDALWHVGQIVSFRRSSGNPFNSKVSVFSGTVSEK